MGARDTLTMLTAAGMAVSVDGERLLVQPASRLTDDQRIAVRADKSGIVALLQRHGSAWNTLDPLPETGPDWDDDRVTCQRCQHYRPSRCSNHRRAGLDKADLGRDLATLPQRCPGFAARPPVNNGPIREIAS